MAISIIKADSRGVYRRVAECDLYLDESRSRVIIVRDGEEVPKEAAFVLAGKGGTIPPQYANLLTALDAPVEVKPEPPPEVKAKPEPLPPAPVLEPKAKPKAQVKPEEKQETPA